MKVIGLICEYNPLHNGHIHHFNQIKGKSNADIIIVSMSSSLTQRGDLAILDKFTRTKLALKMGVDLVIECPSILAMNEAYIFAQAHVNNLNKLGVSEIWIGSEQNNPQIYESYVRLVSSSEFNKSVKNSIAKGLSPKQAYHQAFIDNNVKPLLPNDLLGMFYFQAIKKINPNILLKTIQRTNDFSSNEFNPSLIQSASAIRQNLNRSDKYVPEYVLPYLKDALDINKVVPFLRYNIANCSDLNNLIEANEGIENRLPSIPDSSFNDIVDFLSTRRYSEGKIRRLLMDVLFNLTKDDLKECLQDQNFVRVLGFTNKGKQLLNMYKKKIKIYTNIKDNINKTLDTELKISRILDIIYNTNMFVHEQKGPIK